MKFTKKSIWISSLLLVCLVGGFILFAGFDTPFLFREKGAVWLYIDRPFIPEAQGGGQYVSYRKRFTVAAASSNATLTVCSLRVSSLLIDGKPVPPVTSEISRWKGRQVFDLAGFVPPGTHEILIRVYNENGPAVELAYSDALNLRSGLDWEASYDELVWTPAVAADTSKQPELAEHFDRSDRAFISLLPVYAPVFFAAFALTLTAFSTRAAGEKIRKFIPTASRLRWLLFALWISLAINNILKIPILTGMDVHGHYQYIGYIVKTGRLPLATEGWQMFQSPLYYVLSALVWMFPLSQWFEYRTAESMLRAIPLLCGLLQIELAYRATRLVFPNRNDLQIAGTVIGGLLPMNVYISQVVGNEPLAGLLSASAVVIGLTMLTSEQQIIRDRYFILLGTALGLALLTKMSAILLIPPSFILAAYVLRKRQQSIKYIFQRLVWIAGIIVVLAGWYYIRNWFEYGKFFVGGWESTRWWQDPGYRTVSQFLTFGQSVSSPIYSAVAGFWDSLYSTLWLDGAISGMARFEDRPPWHYDFMISGALLSLLPAASMLIGIVISVNSRFRSVRSALVFSVCCIAVYLAALLYMYVTLPVWSTAKATYTLGLIPCYALLTTAGIEYLSRNNLLRAAINGCLACWAVAAYCSYFVL